MDRFFRLVASRPGLVLAIAALLALGGVYNLMGLAVDAVPDISPKQVMILTEANGLGPLETERLVTFPVENAMAGTPGLKSIRSTSRFGLSAVYVTFDDGTDVDRDRTFVSERLQTLIPTLPPGVGQPQLGPVATGLGEVYQFEVVGPGYTPMELHRILQWQIAPKLKLVPGVTDVNIYGGDMETFEVRIDADALRRYGLTLQSVFDAVSTNNATRGGAYVEHGDSQEIVRGMGLVTDLRDIGRIVLATGPGGTPITIDTVGTVVKAPMVRLGAVTHDGEGETVVGVALMLYGQNASEVVKGIKAEVAKLGKTLPPGIAIRPYYDRTELVGRTIETVEHNLFEGAILVVAVLLLTLGSLPAGLIVACAIPLSMLIAFAGMRAFGISANLMSLGAIDFGLIVDGAVVMVDAILTRAGSGGDRARLIGSAASEVARPVSVAVLIIVIVYAPILSLGSVEGKMFKPMAETVILALLGSLVLTLTVIPALAAVALPLGRRPRGETWLVRGLRRVYTPSLGACAGHPRLVALCAVLLVAGAFALSRGLGGEFLPQLSEGSIVVTSEKLPGIDLDASLRTVTAIEKVIRSFPEVSKVVSLTGSAAIPTDPMGVESTDSFVSLTPRRTWHGAAASQEDLVGQLDKALSDKVPGVAFSFSQPIQMRMEDLLQGVKADVGILISGNDLGELHRLADEVTGVVKGLKGAADVKPEAQSGMPYLTIAVDREAVARYGMNANDVLNVVDAIGGHKDGTVYGQDNSETTIVVRWPPADRADIETIRRLPVFDGTGRVLPLSELAHISLADGPAQISREGLARRTSVSVNLRGIDAATFVATAEKAVAAKVKLPSGYTIEWNGQFRSMQEADARLMVVVPIAMAAIFLLLVFLFDDLRLAALIFLVVPVSASGGILALVLRGMPFSISAAIGFIATFGIATLNGVVLASYIKDERARGHDAATAAREAAERRLRPVAMTALVAALGFLPMAISTGAGAEVQRPLATVVIGGLIVATALTLLVLPALYPIADGLFRRKRPAQTKPTVKLAAE